MGTTHRDLTQHSSPPLVGSNLPPAVPSAGSPPSTAVSVDGNADEQHEPSGRERCIRSGCPNPAAESRVWDNEYCSSECLVAHCRDVFQNWVLQRKAAGPGSPVQ